MLVLWALLGGLWPVADIGEPVLEAPDRVFLQHSVGIMLD